MDRSYRPLAVVTGASTSIGLELARLCAQKGFDLIIAADGPLIRDAARELSDTGVGCTVVQCDLATAEGVQQLIASIDGRPVDVLLANAGRGLGQAFLDQELDDALRAIHANIDGTIRLIYAVASGMRARGQGRILITGAIPSRVPGEFQAVYNGSRAFIDSFSVALSNELKDVGVSVTCLMPGATEPNFIDRADRREAQSGNGESSRAADVAKVGFDAMMQGDLRVVAAFGNKRRSAVSPLAGGAASAGMRRPVTDRVVPKKIEPWAARDLSDRPRL